MTADSPSPSTAAESAAPSDEPGDPLPAAAPATADQTPRRRRRIPLFVLAVTAVHIALALMCTFLYPPFAGYDETWHVDMTKAYYDGHGVYDPGERRIDRGIDAAASGVPVPPPSPPYAERPTAPRGERRSFDSLNDGKPGYPVPNQMVQHPPLYYLVEAGLLKLVPGSADLPYDRQVWLLRLFSVLMIAPLPLLAWATVRRLIGEGPAALSAAVVPATLPGLTRVGGSVNNDNLLALLTAALTLVLAAVVMGDLRKRTALLAGGLTALALLTKGLALMLPPVVVVAYLVAWLRHRRRPLAPLLVALPVAAIGGAWWVRNYVLYGAVQPSGLGDDWAARLRGKAVPGYTVIEFPDEFLGRFVRRVWGGFGLPDAPNLPPWVTTGWFVLLLAGIVIALAVGNDGRWDRLALAVFVLPGLLVTAAVYANAQSAFLFSGRFPAIQGRYLYCAIVGLAAVAAIGWAKAAGPARRVLPLTLAVTGLLTQAAAWALIMLSWWTPTAAAGDRVAQVRGAFEGILRWSPWPVGITWAAFAAVVMLSVLLLVLAVREAVRRIGGPADGTSPAGEPPEVPSSPASLPVPGRDGSARHGQETSLVVEGT